MSAKPWLECNGRYMCRVEGCQHNCGLSRNLCLCCRRRLPLAVEQALEQAWVESPRAYVVWSLDAVASLNAGKGASVPRIVDLVERPQPRRAVRA